MPLRGVDVSISTIFHLLRMRSRTAIKMEAFLSIQRENKAIPTYRFRMILPIIKLLRKNVSRYQRNKLRRKNKNLMINLTIFFKVNIGLMNLWQGFTSEFSQTNKLKKSLKVLLMQKFNRQYNKKLTINIKRITVIFIQII